MTVCRDDACDVQFETWPLECYPAERGGSGGNTNHEIEQSQSTSTSYLIEWGFPCGHFNNRATERPNISWWTIPSLTHSDNLWSHELDGP